MRSSDDRSGDLDPDVGLCSICRHARLQSTARGGRFWRCLRADTDPHYVRYPRLPVVKCRGHEEPGAG
jgi:hypothetical protein